MNYLNTLFSLTQCLTQVLKAEPSGELKALVEKLPKSKLSNIKI